MSVWANSWRLVRFRPLFYGLCMTLWVSFMLLPLASGLIVRAFFDGLTGDAPATFGPLTLVGLLLGVELGRVAVFYISLISWFNFAMAVEGLLRANMLGWLTGGPGARTLPLNRFHFSGSSEVEFPENRHLLSEAL